MKANSSKTRRLLRVLVFCLLIVVAVFGWRVVPLMLAEPTITVDYVAEFNRITKPQDYDPEVNAAPYYEKLFSELTSLPGHLIDIFTIWPTNLSPDEIDTLKEWAAAHRPAFEAMSEGAKRPYWWSEATSSDGSMPGIQLQHSQKQRELTWSAVLLAKYKASQGDSDGAFQVLADLHMMGVHRSRRETVVEQMVGLAIRRLCYQAILDILSRCEVSFGAIDRMRWRLASPGSQVDFPRFTRGEFLVALDAIQRAFTDDGEHDGKLIPKELHKSKKEGGLYVAPLSYPEAVLICLTHPGRKETLETYTTFYELLSELARKTPWELQAQRTTYTDELRPLVEGNFFLGDGIQTFGRVIEVGWQGRTDERAVETVLAILAYKAQKGDPPDSLEELRAAGYLKEVPTDPYSGKPLVYRITDDDFTLYSVGADFSDNSGIARSWIETEEDGDRVFWPVRDVLEDMLSH